MSSCCGADSGDGDRGVSEGGVVLEIKLKKMR